MPAGRMPEREWSGNGLKAERESEVERSSYRIQDGTRPARRGKFQRPRLGPVMTREWRVGIETKPLLPFAKANARHPNFIEKLFAAKPRSA